MRIESKFKIGALLILVIMLLTGIVPFRVAHWAQTSQNALRESQAKIESLTKLLSLMKDAETGQRGFVITGKEPFLDPYHSAKLQLGQISSALQRQAASSAEFTQVLNKAFRLVDLKMAELSETIELRRSKGFNAVEPIVRSARGKGFMDELRQIVDEFILREGRNVVALQAELDRRTNLAVYTGLGVTIVNLAFLIALLGFMFQLLKGRQETSDALRKTGADLATSMLEVERRNMEISMVAQMTRALESTLSVKETFNIIAIYCAKLFPHTSGTLNLFRNSRDTLEREAQWGNPKDAPQFIEPQDCWALRRGQPHQTESLQDLCCAHYQSVSKMDRHLCIPLNAQGEVLGLICLEATSASRSVVQIEENLAIGIAEQIALALSNAKLREMLKQQSIIDPLTGLFNRRYMDETLKRELSRTARTTSQLSMIVLDVDHFKKINDAHGHDVGDLVLKSISHCLISDIRGADFACRYGGEELVLILPECPKNAAFDRAEKIRENIQLLDIRHGMQRIEGITASFGVATFPEDGDDGEELFRATDRALYLAKNSGRNCVIGAN